MKLQPRFPRPRFLLAALCIFWSLHAAAFAQQEPLRIAAAADLQPVLPPVLDRFHQSTGIDVQATYQASAALTTQIQNGAPFDLFLSADLSYPKRLIDAGAAKGLRDPASPTPYAHGALVLWTRNDSAFAHPSQATLTNPNLKRLAIANPDRAPYGRAAIATLTSLHLLDALRPKFATAENIAQTAQFAESGNADAGLISMTSARIAHLSSIGSFWVVPSNLYPPIEQGAAIVTKSTQQANARRFLEFLLSPPIQQELAKSGLTPVN
ncbi:molybdate ABC transporter substrate-binding protein [Acidicapsa dinghuensis]|uniref:Molybdate ABC transporter substrate-binding protein n=1 Tax=Acidicapsa dinghuensis TaxID=2218256 RepID=A0ABW1EHB6_9BACT|nr:molybdate ABC transporter substrate-binding protein [Acidicapsa dinghuensis]